MKDSALKIGNLDIFPPLVLAPMAGITNSPFRKVCRQGGAGLVFTEMISSRALSFKNRRTRDMGIFLPGEHPVAAQLFGRDPEEMARSALFLQEAGADIIDINMGCPVKKVLKSGCGVQLMREPDLAASVARAVVKAVDVPVTVKLRTGWSSLEMNYTSLSRTLEAEGVDAVILHPRTRTQGFTGRADWECIGHLKETLSIAVIGSGDVVDAGTASRMFERTGCDGVMIGRRALGRPWIFKEISSEMGLANRDVDTAFCKDLIREHMDLILEHFPGKRSVGQLRKHLGWYSRGFPGGSYFRRTINSMESSEQIVDLAEEFLGLTSIGKESGAGSQEPV